MFSYFTLKCGVLLIIFVFFANAQQQEISFWLLKEDGNITCGGPPTVKFEESGIYQIDPSYQSGIISYAQHGLWRVEFILSGSIVGETNVNNHTACYSYEYRGGGLLEIRATRYGDSFQNESSITFFPKPSLNGPPFKIDEGGQSGLNFAAKSYFFTGPYSWEISDENGGNKTCLLNRLRHSRQNGFSVEFGVDFILGSVQIGCSGGTSNYLERGLILIVLLGFLKANILILKK